MSNPAYMLPGTAGLAFSFFRQWKREIAVTVTVSSGMEGKNKVGVYNYCTVL
jgi:hypothetical protein